MQELLNKINWIRPNEEEGESQNDEEDGIINDCDLEDMEEYSEELGLTFLLMKKTQHRNKRWEEILLQV